MGGLCGQLSFTGGVSHVSGRETWEGDRDNGGGEAEEGREHGGFSSQWGI